MFCCQKKKKRLMCQVQFHVHSNPSFNIRFKHYSKVPKYILVLTVSNVSYNQSICLQNLGRSSPDQQQRNIGPSQLDLPHCGTTNEFYARSLNLKMKVIKHQLRVAAQWYKLKVKECATLRNMVLNINHIITALYICCQ